MTGKTGRSPVQALDLIRTNGLVPLHASSDAVELFRLGELAVEAGTPVLEVTLRVPGALEALSELVHKVDATGLPLLVGAGTVLDVAAVEGAISAGVRFIVSPILTPEVGARCRSGDVAWIPGCATPTEIHTALELGCDAVKLFPADAIGGPDFLRSVRAVFPDVQAIPSGGVVPDADQLGAWFGAGAIAVAMGSQLFPPAAIADQDWRMVQQRLAVAVSAVADARERLER